MMDSKFSILFLLAFLDSSFCQTLKVGDVANKIESCRGLYMTKVLCPNTDELVCAVAGGKYISGQNSCKFCVQYGNLNALIVQIGTADEQFKCAPFEQWSKASDDPYCKYIKRSGQLGCTREYFPICATMDDKPFIGSNKCEFCKKYGDTKVAIVTMGKPCTELKIGDIVRDNKKCNELAFTKTACTFEYNPICAYDYKTFMSGSNFCDFCQKYGNSSGVVVEMGPPQNGGEFICKGLGVGDRALDAPHCEYVCETWQKNCTMPPKTVCALLDGTVSSISTCEFCKKYGCFEALVTSIGEPCSTE